jgi:hypothetical protein
MSLAAVLRASNPSQPKIVTEIKYSSRNSTACDHVMLHGVSETPSHRMYNEYWHGTPLSFSADPQAWRNATDKRCTIECFRRDGIAHMETIALCWPEPETAY